MLSLRSLRHPGFYLVVVGLALLANYLFTGEWISRFRDQAPMDWHPEQTAASLCLILAVAGAAWVFGRGDSFRIRLESSASDPVPPAPSPVSPWTILPSLSLYAVATLAYVYRGESWTVRIVWGLSVIALLLPLIRRFDRRDFWPIPFWEYALLVIILCGAFVARYVRLTEIPYHVDNDVSIMGLYSRNMVTNGDWRLIGMARTDHHYSEHQYIALSMRLFGLNHYGLGMLSVLAGTATCGLVHLIGRTFFNRWVGLLGAAFLATNYVHIHFSRIIFGPISTFFVVAAGLCLLHGMKRANAFSFAAGGVSLGLGLMGYYSARIGPVVAGGLFMLWWLQRRRYPGIPLRYWGVALLGLLCAFGPNLAFAVDEFTKFSGRGSKVILWTDIAWSHLSDKYQSHGSAWIVIKEQIIRTFLGPFYFPDESTICFLRKPMLGGLAAISFMLGLGFCLRRCRDMACTYLLGSFVLTFIFGGVLTIDPPFWPHLNIALPAMVLIAAIGIERLARRLILTGRRPAAFLVPVLLSGGVVASGVHEWEVYHAFARDHAGARILSMRQILRLSPETRVYLISKYVFWEQETFQFFTPHYKGQNITEQELYASPPKIEKPTTFFVFDDAEPGCADFLMKTYPGARRQGFRDGWQWPAFFAIHVFPAGFEEHPQRFLRPVEMRWMSPGWRLIGVVVLLGLSAGWILLRRDQRRLERRLPRLPAGPS